MKCRTIVIMCIVFVIGLGVLLYPTVSNYINEMNQSKRIAEYDNVIATMSEQDYTEELQKATQYNVELLKKENRFKLSDEEMEEYNSVLNVNGQGIMGYLEIEKLGVKLSIGHGMSDDVLEVGVGHMEGTSLPCGGVNNHAALIGHRGLPSAKLFTDLDQMKLGDTFIIHILNQTYTYQVCKISTVKPDDMSELEIEEGKDYVTLITCTPYAVNSHRLLVRGVRIANIDSKATSGDASDTQKDFNLMEYVPIIAAVILLLAFIIVIILFAKKRE